MAVTKVDELTVLTLGQAGENIASSIEIDVGAWKEKWPDASIFIVAVRPGETEPYIVNTTIEENILTWTVREVDVGRIGVGYCEVRAVGLDGLVKKTRIIRTVTDKSLSNVETSASDELMTYVQDILSAANVVYRSRLRVVSDEDGLVTIAGGNVEEGGYLLDTTLTQTGRAADAGAVMLALEQKADKNVGAYDPRISWPVGSILVTESDVNPSMTIGGTWERMENVVLFGASEMHPAGSVGGTETVTLTYEQVP